MRLSGANIMSSALLGPDPNSLTNPYTGRMTLAMVRESVPGYGTVYFGPNQLFEQDLAVLWMDTQRRQRILDAGKIPVLLFTYAPNWMSVYRANDYQAAGGQGGAYQAYGYVPRENDPLITEYQATARQQIINDVAADNSGKPRQRIFTSDGIPAFRFADMQQAIFASQLTEQQRIDNATLAIAERAGLSPQQVVDISEVAPTNPIAAQYVQALIQQRLIQLGLARQSQVSDPLAATQLPATQLPTTGQTPSNTLASQITTPAASATVTVLAPPVTATATATPAASNTQTPSNTLASGTPTATTTGTQVTSVTANNAAPAALAQAQLAGVPLATIDQGTTVMRLIAAVGSIWFMLRKGR
jgi:hypothetical protein